MSQTESSISIGNRRVRASTYRPSADERIRALEEQADRIERMVDELLELLETSRDSEETLRAE